MRHFILIILLFIQSDISAQQPGKLIIVTLDGMRWQEVFGGIDDSLSRDSVFTRERQAIQQTFGAATAAEKRQKLFPFLWNQVSEQGLLLGNRWQGSRLDNANPYWFSYPGYNEIFTGYPDTAVNSNDKTDNKNETVLDFLNRQPGYKNQVAVFATWDVFPSIFNEKKSHLYVNADNDTLPANAPDNILLNDLQRLAPRPLGVRPDVITYLAAKTYLRQHKPRVLYIAFDETDDYAHGGMYDAYIGAAHAEDAMIADLWNTLQSDPDYRGQTTLLVTCDHGRGDQIKSQWRHHGQDIKDSHEIWLAAMGPGIAQAGEVKNGPPQFQAQIAATLAAVLGFHFKTDHPVMPVLNILQGK